MKNKIVLYAKTVGELMEAYNIAMLENNRLREELEELRETYNIILIEINKLRKLEDVRRELEGYKKKVDKVTQSIWEYHTIYGSLSTDFVIKEVEKLKEVKSKWKKN